MHLENPKDIVLRGYEKVAAAYLETGLHRAEYAGWLARLALPSGSDVLDLGCGSGVPTARILARDHRVTGVDLSPAQILLGKAAVPDAEFLCADFAEIEFEADRFDAVVALYSLIHLPLARQPIVLGRIARWLRPGGRLLATVGHRAWTGTEENWLGVAGATMYWSHADSATYRQWMAEAGFRIEWETFVAEGSGGHDLMLARLDAVKAREALPR